MEGVRCEQAGCGCHDFLPFQCARCRRAYCLDHRSRFVHTCRAAAPEDAEEVVAPAAASSQMPSVKKMMSDVFGRFGGSTSSPAKSHTPIRSATEAQLPTKTAQRLQLLEQQETSVARQTRKMLLKRNAAGNCAVDPKQRLYVSVKLAAAPEGPAVGHFFFASYISVGEMLRDLRTALPTTFPLVGADTALSAFTLDTEDWRQWDRRAMLSTVLADCETIYAQLRPLDEVLRAQKELEAVAAEAAAATASAAAGAAGTLLDKGSLAWYHRTSPAPASFEDAQRDGTALSLVRVLGVHLDDMPNIYYTIVRCRDRQPQLLGRTDGEGAGPSVDFEGEKQTDAPRLLACPADFFGTSSSPATPAATTATTSTNTEAAAAAALQELVGDGDGPQWTIVLQHRKRTLQLRARPVATLAALRRYAALALGLPERGLKMIHRGATLKGDTTTLKAARLGDQARVMVLG